MGFDMLLTVDMLAIANLASHDRYCNPGPVNSTIRSAAMVFRLNCFKMYRIVSFPPTPFGGLLTRRRFTDFGTLNHVCPVTNGMHTSVAPMPMDKQLIAPAEHVCESAPIQSIPGCALSRTNSVCKIVYYFVRIN